MDLTTTIGIGLLLIFIAIIFIWQPWSKGNLELITREEKDDKMRTPAHIDPVIKEQVTEVVKAKRVAAKAVVTDPNKPKRVRVKKLKENI